MVQVMIMSLGGSPEPLRKSILEHAPEQVIFLASHASAVMAGQVLECCGIKPRTFFIMTEDSDDILACYEASAQCLKRLDPEIPPESVMIDYTGGTKPMVAALILASVGTGKAFQYNYVAGRRDKNGLGTVQSGSEHMMPAVSPWAVFAEEERRQMVVLFNERRFSAVVRLIGAQKTRPGAPPRITRIFEWMDCLAQGYALWEQFEHKEALELLKKGLNLLTEHQELFSHEGPSVAYKASVESNVEFLKRLLGQTQGGSRVHDVLVEDLLANARRRLMDHRYEDAVARVYRALEMYGQTAFQEATGETNSEVPPAKLPEGIRDEYLRKYLDEQRGFLKLPLFATFRFLQASGHPVGNAFETRFERLRKVMEARNASVLAHGIRPIRRDAAESFFEEVAEFVGVDTFEEFPVFS